MKKIILIMSILISILSTSTANNKIANEKDIRYDLNISIDGLKIEKLYLLSVFYRDKYDREIGLKWLDHNYRLNLKQYENTLRQIFKIFKKKFPNKKLESLRSNITVVESTYNAINNDVKKYLRNRKGLARMKDKKLREVVKKSFLKTKQLEITCRLALEILHQKCQQKPLFIDPVAIQRSFHEKRSWIELSEEEKPLPSNLFSINFEI